MPMENIESVLVTVQANLDCVSVFKYAARLAERLKAKLFAVDVVHDPFAVMGWNLPIPSLKDDYRTLLTDVRIRLKAMVAEEKERGFPAEYLLREGDPAEEVIKVVQAERIDLLIMPYHEETRLEHFLSGKMAERVVRKMPCSVLLVREEPESLCSLDQ